MTTHIYDYTSQNTKDMIELRNNLVKKRSTKELSVACTRSMLTSTPFYKVFKKRRLRRKLMMERKKLREIEIKIQTTTYRIKKSQMDDMAKYRDLLWRTKY